MKKDCHKICIKWKLRFSCHFISAKKAVKCTGVCDVCTLRWRHNGCDSVSNHQPHHCLLNRLFRRRSKKTLKLRVTGLCVGNSPETSEFPAQMASNAENVSIWWRHHELLVWFYEYQYIREATHYGLPMWQIWNDLTQPISFVPSFSQCFQYYILATYWKSRPYFTGMAGPEMRQHLPNVISCWRHQIETFSALLAICTGNLPVTVEFPAHRPVTRSFDVFFDLHLNKQLSKQWWGWWFETSSRPLWRHCSDMKIIQRIYLVQNHKHSWDVFFNNRHLQPVVLIHGSSTICCVSYTLYHTDI